MSHPGDPLWIKSLLMFHIAAGTTAFIMAPLALVTAKGGEAHRRWGKIYFWAMAFVACSALVLALFRPILFLALVAVFSFYAAFAAYRVLYLKDLPRGGKAKALDWGAAIFTFVASAALAGLGAFRPAAVQHMGIVSIVFGLIGMRFALLSIKDFIWPPKEKMFWWYGHLQGMIASYIAAWSAFSVTTLSRAFGNAWYVWLWPTMIGVPAIVLMTAYYKRKFEPKPKAVTA